MVRCVPGLAKAQSSRTGRLLPLSRSGKPGQREVSFNRSAGYHGLPRESVPREAPGPLQPRIDRRGWISPMMANALRPMCSTADSRCPHGLTLAYSLPGQPPPPCSLPDSPLLIPRTVSLNLCYQDPVCLRYH